MLLIRLEGMLMVCIWLVARLLCEGCNQFGADLKELHCMVSVGVAMATVVGLVI